MGIRDEPHGRDRRAAGVGDGVSPDPVRLGTTAVVGVPALHDDDPHAVGDAALRTLRVSRRRVMRAEDATRPTLDAIVADPTVTTTLPTQTCAALVAQASAVLAALSARLAIATSGPPPAEGLLGVVEAAKLLGLAPDTLYRKVRRDRSYRSLTVDNRTDRVVFNAAKVRAFVTRRMR